MIYTTLTKFWGQTCTIIKHVSINICSAKSQELTLQVRLLPQKGKNPRADLFEIVKIRLSNGEGYSAT